MVHALSFDIEDWFHIVEIEELEDRSLWDHFSKRSIVEERTDQILSILDDHGTKATFFILGWVAEKYPDLAPKIAAGGHEIASHSYWHRKVYELSPATFHNDLERSIDVLQEQTGVKVHGFRAPSFSITPGTEWAFEIMADLGITYDASLFPAERGHGGYADIPFGPHYLDARMSKTGLAELPMSVFEFGRVKVPFSGGGYLRFLPEWVIHLGFKKMEEQNRPAVAYLHPRDFAPDVPRASMSFFRRFKCYTGLETTEKKLHSLLEAYDFDTCENVLKEALQLKKTA